MYPGGKNGEGVYQTIINQLPPHRIYIEAFAGSGAVLRNKRPAQESIAIDIDARSCDELASLELPGLAIWCGDALGFLRSYPWTGGELVYCDPPYLMEVRAKKEAIYRHEFATEEQHFELLSLLLTLPSAIVISGYGSRMYDELLCSWRRVTYPASTRGGWMAEEVLWMNYPEPARLHDYRHLGTNYRERERIKRKKTRWVARLRGMPALERYAMLAALEEWSTLAVPGGADPHGGSGDAGSRG